MHEPIWLSEADVVGLLALDEAVTALREALSAPDAGRANVPKALGRWREGAAIQALGAMLPSSGCVGWKSWAITPSGGAVLYSLFSADDGRLLAAIEAIALGQLRTAAISGVATDLFARPEAAVLGLAGTGRQALAQAAAVLAVRPLQRIRCYSPRAESREAFAQRAEAALGVAVEPVASPAEMARGADIVTLVTRAREPFLTDDMVAPGTHVNAVGAILPDHAEFEPALLGRAAIAVDSPADVRRNSREFREHFGEAEAAWEPVREITSLLAGGAPPRPSDVSVFKAMGMGLSDLAIAKAVFDRARAGGVGRPLDPRRPAAIRLSSRAAALGSGGQK